MRDFEGIHSIVLGIVRNINNTSGYGRFFNLPFPKINESSIPKKYLRLKK